MFKFLKALGIYLFNFLRQPETLGKIKTRDADHYNDKKYFPQPVKVANYANNCPAEKVAGPTQYQHPNETAAQRKQDKAQVGHAPHSIKHARCPAQSIDIL